MLDGGGWSWVEVKMSWVQVDGAGWSWVHGLVIPVFRNFAKFTGNHLCQSLFFNKDAGLRPVSFVKFLRTPFPTEHLWWLLLKHSFVQKATIETLEKCLKHVQS